MLTEAPFLALVSSCNPDVFRRSFNQSLLDRHPSVLSLTSRLQISGGESCRSQFFTVDDHQLLSFGVVQQVHQTHRHHSRVQLVSLGAHQRLDVRQGELEPRVVQAGPASGGFREIRSGLAGGELLLAGGVESPRAGMRVKVSNP